VLHHRRGSAFEYPVNRYVSVLVRH
jgi:hypothetical protein